AVHGRESFGGVDQLVDEAAQEGAWVGGVVAGGEVDVVGGIGGLCAGDQVLHDHGHTVGALGESGDPSGVVQVQAPAAVHFLRVVAAVQFTDQVRVDHRVVGVAVVVHDLAFDALGGGVEGVHGLGVEDAVGEGAVVGGAVAVAGQHRVDLRLGETLVEVVGDLGGALAGTHHDEGVWVGPWGEFVQAVEQVFVVPDAGGLLQSLGHAGT